MKRRSFVTSASVVAIFALTLFGRAPDARAQDRTKEECISANESAQTLRSTGKLRGARAQLLVCIDKSCPEAVRDDCAERLNEVERAIPTIVFTAKGRSETDLSAVVVTMDGSPLADRLDGAAISVDPGEHTFEFVSEGYPNVKRQFIVREGAKARQEVVSFVSPEGPGVAPIIPPSPVTPPGESPPPEADGSSRRLLAYVVGGVGLVGIGLGAFFGLRARSTYNEAESHCPTGPASCDPDGVSGGKDAHTQATVSTIGFIAGGALLAGGVVLFFTAPSGRALNVQPAATAGGGGIRVGGAF